MHTSAREPWTLLDPQESFSTPFARDEQSLGVGGVFAVNFDDFYRQHSFGFHSIGALLLWFLLTLTSSTSFDAYLKSGATGANLGQNGANPRPAGLPLSHLAMKLRGKSLEFKNKSYQDGFCKSHKKRPKGLNQIEWRAKPMTTQRIRAQFNLRSNMGQVINVSVQNEPEPK